MTFSSLLSIVENPYAQGFSTKLCVILLLRLLWMYECCCILKSIVTQSNGLSWITVVLIVMAMCSVNV